MACPHKGSIANVNLSYKNKNAFLTLEVAKNDDESFSLFLMDNDGQDEVDYKNFHRILVELNRFVERAEERNEKEKNKTKQEV